MAVKIAMTKIKGCPDYSITRNGDVYSTKNGTPYKLKPYPSQGYDRVKMVRPDGKIRTASNHRLVAETYLKKPKGMNIVNHKDGNKSNNKVTNLEWTNHRGNMKHYGEKLAYKYTVKRAKQKQDLLQAKLNVANHAHATFKDNPEEFAKIYGAIFG